MQIGRRMSANRKGDDEFEFEIRSEATSIEQYCFGQGIHLKERGHKNGHNLNNWPISGGCYLL